MKCVISGGKYSADIEQARQTFESNDIQVLYPLKNNIIIVQNITSLKALLSSAHSIRETDFLYLIEPEGILSDSQVYLDIGLALAHKKPIFSSAKPRDTTLQQYITGPLQPSELIKRIQSHQ